MATTLPPLLYLDAGTGSVLLAALAGGVAGFRLFILNLKGKMALRRKKATNDGASDSEHSDEA